MAEEKSVVYKVSKDAFNINTTRLEKLPELNLASTYDQMIVQINELKAIVLLLIKNAKAS